MFRGGDLDVLLARICLPPGDQPWEADEAAPHKAIIEELARSLRHIQEQRRTGAHVVASDRDEAVAPQRASAGIDQAGTAQRGVQR